MPVASGLHARNNLTVVVELVFGFVMTLLGVAILVRPAGRHVVARLLAGCFGVFLALNGLAFLASGLR